MRLIGTASTVFAIVLSSVLLGVNSPEAHQLDGRQIFRFDTFGDEQLWTDFLRMHEVVAALDPKTALSVGLKVDVRALPRSTVAALRADDVDLTSPAVTNLLLRLDAVVGIKGTFDEAGGLTRVGITCALCHSTVDNSLTPGIGRRLDGWANRDLNVGAIVALSPALPEALKTEFKTWGPGKYDPRHHAFDGTNLIALNSPSLPIVIPSIFGLKGVGFETFTADGPIWYWNSYVAVGQMGGHGSFSDPRIGLSITQTPDLVTPKLGALLDYQLRLAHPEPPPGQLRSERRVPRQAAVQRRGWLRQLPPAAPSHGRAGGPAAQGAVSSRSSRSGHGSAVRRTFGDWKIPDDAAASAVAAPAVLPRRQRARLAGRRGPLRSPLQPESYGWAEVGSGRVSEVAVMACFWNVWTRCMPARPGQTFEARRPRRSGAAIPTSSVSNHWRSS